MDKSTDHDKSLFDLFLPGMNVKENVYFRSEREFKKALRDTLMRAAWYLTVGTLRNDDVAWVDVVRDPIYT